MSALEKENKTIRFQEKGIEYTLKTTEPISYRPRYEIKRNSRIKKILIGIDLISGCAKREDVFYADAGRQIYRSGNEVSDQPGHIPMIGLEQKLIP